MSNVFHGMYQENVKIPSVNAYVFQCPVFALVLPSVRADYAPSWSRQVYALVAKRVHTARRDAKSFLLQFAVPVAIIALGMGLLRLPIFVAQDVNALDASAQYGDAGAPLSIPVLAGARNATLAFAPVAIGCGVLCFAV